MSTSTADLFFTSSHHHNHHRRHQHSEAAIMSRRSIFGSVRDKLSRKSSGLSSHSTEESRPQTQAFRGPTELNNGAAAVSGPAFNSNPFSNPSQPTRRPRNDPPPAYSESPTEASGPTLPASPAYTPRDPSPAPSTHSGISATTPEDPHAFLTSFDTVFLIDDSGSMAGRSWREVKAALKSITPVCTDHDSDGIDVYFLNAKSNQPADPSCGAPAGGYRNITTAAQVEHLFSTVRPGGGTPTGQRLNGILKPYLRHYEARVAAAGGDPDDSGVKPLNMIVITDGVPTDDPESVLVSVARKLDALEAPPYQIGVQFFQVGNEPGAREALRDLDDNLGQLAGGGDVRDIVDTVTWDGGAGTAQELTADGILKTVLGAVVKRLDRRQLSVEEQRAGSRRTHLAP